jgi:hypothetical protein
MGGAIMPPYLAGLLGGLALAAVVLVLAWRALRGQELSAEQNVRFVCPRYFVNVDAQILQDIRTGQWKRVRRCTGLEGPRLVLCEADCARLMNLGHRLPAAHA